MKGPRWAPAAAAAGIVLIALVAWYGGPVRVGAPVLPLDQLGIQWPDFGDEPTADPPESDLDRPAGSFEGYVTSGSLILAAAVVIVGLILLVRGLRRLVARVGERPLVVVDDHEVHIEEALTRALADAADDAARDVARAAPGQAADAVVACWVRLERAAAGADTPRAAHQTPSEFTAELLAEHHADTGAVTELLALYYPARFGTEPLPDDAAERAAHALRKIAATLRSRRAGQEAP